MQDLPSNSQKAKASDAAPREDLKPVTSAETRERKNGIGRKFRKTFFAGSGKDAVHLMVEDHLVPSIRDMLVNALQGGIESVFYGDRTSRKRTTASSITNPATMGTRVDYASIAGAPTKASQQARTLSRQARAQHNLAELIIPTRAEAETVIDRMYDILSRDGIVTVADLYVLTSVRPDHTDLKYGWTNLRGARAVGNVNRGYRLDLPEPEALA